MKSTIGLGDYAKSHEAFAVTKTRCTSGRHDFVQGHCVKCGHVTPRQVEKERKAARHENSH